MRSQDIASALATMGDNPLPKPLSGDTCAPEKMVNHG